MYAEVLSGNCFPSSTSCDCTSAGFEHGCVGGRVLASMGNCMQWLDSAEFEWTHICGPQIVTCSLKKDISSIPSVASIRLWFANIFQVTEQLYDLILYSTINYYTTWQFVWRICRFVRKETQNRKLKSAARHNFGAPNMTGLLDSQTIQTCMEFHVWRSMESLCISGMMRAEIRHDGLDREAKSEAVGSKVNSRFHNWVGYCIEHVFELLFFLQGTGISNFFGILGCKVQATTDKRKTLGLPVRWQRSVFCSGFKLAHDLLLASKVWFGWGQCCNLQWVFFSSAHKCIEQWPIRKEIRSILYYL